MCDLGMYEMNKIMEMVNCQDPGTVALGCQLVINNFTNPSLRAMFTAARINNHPEDYWECRKELEHCSIILTHKNIEHKLMWSRGEQIGKT